MESNSSPGSNGRQITFGGLHEIKELGYTLSGHAELYGEKFQIVSEPFPEGGGVAVRVVTATNPAIRTLRLPVAMLLGMSKFFPHRLDPVH